MYVQPRTPAIAWYVSSVAVAASADEGADAVTEEAHTEVAEDGERAMPEAAVDGAVAGAEPVGVFAAAAGECFVLSDAADLV